MPAHSLPILLGLAFAGLTGMTATPAPVVLETEHFRYTISSAGKNLHFIDRATGVDYLRSGASTPCAWVTRSGTEYPATAATLADGKLALWFDEAECEAVIAVDVQPAFVRFKVESTPGTAIDALTFLHIPLTLRGTPDEPFGACAFSLNLQTRVDRLPALQSELRAAAYDKFGIVGAKAAIVAVPTRDMLKTLQELLLEADEMPLCNIAGPWAREVPFNRGSYLFNFGAVTEATVEDWIVMARDLGVTQVDHHGGSSFFRFGDFELNREKWPEGWETFTRIVNRLHAAGIGSIFHTYAFFIDKQSKYVTPIPDPRLDAFRTFTLAEPIDADADCIRVNESTAGLNTVTGFFEHNSVFLHLGDELVTFSGVSREPPWQFTGIQRGALGTRATSHAAGARARHLKECFGLFVPNPESSLFVEIAANHAEIVNRCGFDGIYLDAIDGSSILRGPDECWYWADKFVFEIQRRLRKPVGMEMSAMWHHFWQYRTRWQAWDYPQRGHRRFIDLHAKALNGGLLLPLHLGWWNFQSFDPPQVEPTYPEIIEYLGAKLVGWDAGISLTGSINRERLGTVPLFRRAVDILRTCETLRHEGGFDENVKAELRRPGSEFALITDPSGQARFRRSQSAAHVTSLAEPWTRSWTVTNRYTGQSPRLRVEALMSAAAYDDTNGIVLADFSTPDAAWQSSSAEGVAMSFGDPRTESGKTTVSLIATNAGTMPRTAAWARFTRTFDPPLNLREHQALGVWIEGDGLGELLAIRLESPRHIAFGAVADRYLDIDFTEPRQVTLLESESLRWSDYVWNDGKGLYNVYRESINFGAVDSVSVWLQNLPADREARCRLGVIKALPMRSAALKDATVTWNGNTLIFPVELTSGAYLEGTGPDDCTLYDAQGETIRKVIPRGTWPTSPPGKNRIEFTAAADDGPSPRARITTFFYGETL